MADFSWRRCEYSPELTRKLGIARMLQSKFEIDFAEKKTLSPNYRAPTWDEVAAQYDAMTGTRVPVAGDTLRG